MTRETEDKSPDILDAASQLQDAFNKKGIAAAAAAIAPEHDPDFDGKHCMDCPTIIPAARRKMGRIRCVPCQTALEIISKRFKR